MSFEIRNIEALNGSGLGGSINIELSTPENSIWQLSSENFMQNLADYDRYKNEVQVKPTKVLATQFISENLSDSPEFVQIYEDNKELKTYYIEKSDTKLGYGSINEDFNIGAFTELRIELKPESKFQMLFQIEQIVLSDQLDEIIEVDESMPEIQFVETEIEPEKKEKKTVKPIITSAIVLAIIGLLIKLLKN